MKQISLTQNKIAQVDDLDFEWLNKWQWYAHRSGNTYYARRDTKKKNYFMHKEILSTHKIVDHRDRDGLNNQKNNLRIATYSQNNMNKSKKHECSSRFVGVCLLPNGLWKSAINKNRKTIYIGTFHNEADAALAYDKKAKKLHGEFANLNFLKTMP